MLSEVIKGVELPHGIELFVILSVTTLNLAVVPGGKRPDQLMLDSQLLQCAFKQGRLRFSGGQTVGKLQSIVSLNTLDGVREFLHNVPDELSRCIGAVFLKCL